jgi:hypothetical protein
MGMPSFATGNLSLGCLYRKVTGREAVQKKGKLCKMKLQGGGHHSPLRDLLHKVSVGECFIELV